MRIFLVVLLLIPLASFSQNWKDATIPLKYPLSNERAIGGIAWVERYITEPCYYVTKSDTTVRSGYKLVYTHMGYYVDNRRTLGVFYNEKKKRIKNVKSYRWKE